MEGVVNLHEGIVYTTLFLAEYSLDPKPAVGGASPANAESDSSNGSSSAACARTLSDQQRADVLRCLDTQSA